MGEVEIHMGSLCLPIEGNPTTLRVNILMKGHIKPRAPELLHCVQVKY
jgi:hypothetical protein